MSGGRLLGCLTAPLLLIQLPQISIAKQNHKCEPSSCDNHLNISNPFRLTGDPKHCGDQRYELDCENNLTVAYFHSNKYYVQAINYHNFTIRLVDADVLAHNKGNCSPFPRHSLTQYNFSFFGDDPYTISRYGFLSDPNQNISKPIQILSCPNPVDYPLYVEFSPCMSIGEVHFASNSNSSRRRYSNYVHIGYLNASNVKYMCTIDLMLMTSLPGINEEEGNLSIAQVNSALLYGFELWWFKANCRGFYYYLDQQDHLHCHLPFGNLGILGLARYIILGCALAIWVIGHGKEVADDDPPRF